MISQLRLDAETTRERLLGREKEDEASRRDITSLDQRLTQQRSDLDEMKNVWFNWPSAVGQNRSVEALRG